MQDAAREASKKRWQAVLKSVFRRASYDQAFRALCLHAPDEMLRTHFGIEFPEDSKIRFSEAPSNDPRVLVLPQLVKVKLEDNDLKIMSSGSEMRLARYENWGSEVVADLYRVAIYENWGSE